MNALATKHSSTKVADLFITLASETLAVSSKSQKFLKKLFFQNKIRRCSNEQRLIYQNSFVNLISFYLDLQQHPSKL